MGVIRFGSNGPRGSFYLAIGSLRLDHYPPRYFRLGIAHRVPELERLWEICHPRPALVDWYDG